MGPTWPGGMFFDVIAAVSETILQSYFQMQQLPVKLIIPLCYHNTHWVTAVVTFGCRSIVVYDSWSAGFSDVKPAWEVVWLLFNIRFRRLISC